MIIPAPILFAIAYALFGIIAIAMLVLWAVDINVKRRKRWKKKTN